MTTKRTTKGGGIEALNKYLKNLTKSKVQIGVTKDTNARPDGGSNALIGMVMEFGLGVPERSHLRTTIIEQGSKYAEMLSKDIPNAIASGTEAYNAYSILGTIASNDVKLKIRQGNFTPLNPKTIERKGSSKPLIDTGAYIQSITYKVEL